MVENSSRVGGIAGYVGAVGFLVAAGILAGAMFISDPGNNTGWEVYVAWIIAGAVGAISTATVTYAALRRSGGVRGGLAVTALALVVIAAIGGALVAWLWFVWGVVLSVGALLLVLRLRRAGMGATGRPTGWDWVLPVAWPLGLATTLALYATNAFEEIYDDLDWNYVIGFSVGAVLSAAALIQFGRWLSSDPVAPAETPAIG